MLCGLAGAGSWFFRPVLRPAYYFSCGLPPPIILLHSIHMCVVVRFQLFPEWLTKGGQNVYDLIITTSLSNLHYNWTMLYLFLLLDLVYYSLYHQLYIYIIWCVCILDIQTANTVMIIRHVCVCYCVGFFWSINFSRFMVPRSKTLPLFCVLCVYIISFHCQGVVLDVHREGGLCPADILSFQFNNNKKKWQNERLFCLFFSVGETTGVTQQLTTTTQRIIVIGKYTRFWYRDSVAVKWKYQNRK